MKDASQPERLPVAAADEESAEGLRSWMGGETDPMTIMMDKQTDVPDIRATAVDEVEPAEAPRSAEKGAHARWLANYKVTRAITGTVALLLGVAVAFGADHLLHIGVPGAAAAALLAGAGTDAGLRGLRFWLMGRKHGSTRRMIQADLKRLYDGMVDKAKTTARAELATEQSEGTGVSQDAVDLAHEQLSTTDRDPKTHDAFAERILTDLPPRMAAGEVCLNCAKPGGYMVPAGRTESGDQVLVHAGECYMRKKWWSEESQRRARREAAPRIVQVMTDETIRLVLDQVIDAGVRSRRSEIESDAWWTLRRERDAAAKAIAVPPCPAWCTEEVGHPYSPEHDDEEFQRFHRADLLRIEETNTGVEITQCERVKDGVMVFDPVGLYADFETADPEQIRSIARTFTDTVSMVEKLNAGGGETTPAN